MQKPFVNKRDDGVGRKADVHTVITPADMGTQVAIVEPRVQPVSPTHRGRLPNANASGIVTRFVSVVLATSIAWLGAAHASPPPSHVTSSGAHAAGSTPSPADRAGGSMAPAPVSAFDRTFSSDGEPATIHYRVSYAGRDGSHELEVWRDGTSRLRRKTDDALDAYVVRDARETGEYQMIVVDYRKKITTRIDRNNLIRLGHFSDWFDLAHGLRHPIGEYQLSPSEAPKGVPAALGACRWYALAQKGDTHRICWSERDRLPLMIWSEHAGLVWRVTQIDRKAIPRDTFTTHDAGFVRNDANEDIEGD